MTHMMNADSLTHAEWNETIVRTALEHTQFAGSVNLDGQVYALTAAAPPSGLALADIVVGFPAFALMFYAFMKHGVRPAIENHMFRVRRRLEADTDG